MQLIDVVQNYIRDPYPLWESEATELLVQAKWNELRTFNAVGPTDYGTARYLDNNTDPPAHRSIISASSNNEIIHLEEPSFETLQKFYDQHGLEPISPLEIKASDALSKLKCAFTVLGSVQLASSCIQKLVRTILVLKQEDPEIDISYTHPKIPFSIFISVCQDSSILSSLRVAESILHEAMHLKLTLIENVIPLVKPNAGNLYFSPWRDEKRPAQGVLHGAFVFRAILHFYQLILSGTCSLEEAGYLHGRIDQISGEIKQLEDFNLCDDLTKDGAILTGNLLPLN